MKATRTYIRPNLNQWHFVFMLEQAPWRKQGIEFNFGLFKIVSYPPWGEIIQKKHYKGFWIRKDFTFGFGFSFNLPKNKTKEIFIDFLFWKYHTDGVREPSKFHHLLQKVFGRYFNPK